MPKRDWDCGKDGHVPVSKLVKSAGLRKVTRLTWCAVCGKTLKSLVTAHCGRWSPVAFPGAKPEEP